MKTSLTPGTRFLLIGASFFGASLFVGAGYLWGRTAAAHAQPAAPAKAMDQSARAIRPNGDKPRHYVHVHGPGDHPHDHAHGEDHLQEQSIPAAVRGETQDFATQGAPTVSPEKARALEIERVKATGPDRRNLIVDARRVGDDWSKTSAEKKLRVSFDDWQCYRGGCLVNARHDAAGTLDHVTSEITHTRGFIDWNGEKLRTGPVEIGNGKTEVTWILFAPPEGERALPESNP